MSDSIKQWEEKWSQTISQELESVGMEFYDRSKDLIPPKTLENMKEVLDNKSEKGVKESSGKLYYELDFDFITCIAKRMESSKGKYEKYNWKKSMDLDELKQATFRHVLEMMKGNYEDDGRALGHLEAIATNIMMLNYHLK